MDTTLTSGSANLWVNPTTNTKFFCTTLKERKMLPCEQWYMCDRKILLSPLISQEAHQFLLPVTFCATRIFTPPEWDTIIGIVLQATSCRAPNHSKGFDSCLLIELAIITIKPVITTICLLKGSYLTFAKCFLFSVTFCFLWTSFCFLSFKILCILVNREFDIDHNKNKRVLYGLHVL